MDQNWLNTIGLFLDIAGIGLLFFFGIPNIYKVVYEEAGMGDPDRAKGPNFRRNRILTWIGFVLVIFGFGIQICSNHLPCVSKFLGS